MPLPDRPVTGATIESEWGQEIHDYTFAPLGCDVYSATTGSPGSTPGQLALTTATDDPAGFLNAANNRLVVPTGGEGLYLVLLKVNSVNGSAGTGYGTRALLSVNGTYVATAFEDNNGAVNIVVTVPDFLTLAAGDIITVWVQRRGAGTNPTCNVQSLRLVRLGSEFGA